MRCLRCWTVRPIHALWRGIFDGIVIAAGGVMVAAASVVVLVESVA